MRSLTYRRWVPKLWVARPLLQVEKAQLVATCEMRGLEYASDPSNFKPVFDRVRIRQVRHPRCFRATQGGVLSCPHGLHRVLS